MPSHLFRLATCLCDVGEAPKCLSGVLTHVRSREYTIAVEQATMSLLVDACQEQSNDVPVSGLFTRQDLLARVQMQNPQFRNDVPLSGLFTREDLLARVQMQDPHLSDQSRVFQAFHKRFAYIFFESRSCLLYTSPSPRDLSTSRMPSSA